MTTLPQYPVCEQQQDWCSSDDGLSTLAAHARDLPQFENHAQQQTQYTTCYMCACRCGIKVTLENGQVRFIQGNRDHPVNKGVLCAKGNAGIMKQNSPAKLQTPLIRKRNSERGLDFMGSRLRHLSHPLRKNSRHRPQSTRLLYRTRSNASLNRLLGEPIRHTKLGSARRFLLGEHGGGRFIHHGACVLGIRRS